MTMTQESVTYPQIPWGQHLSSLEWDKGDHVLIAAPTKAGKTTLASTLVRKRSHAIVYVTKMKDNTFREEFPARRGWTIYREWPKHGPKPWETHILLWPKTQKTTGATIRNMQAVHGKALEWHAREGGWCQVIDESLMFCDPKMLNFGTTIGWMHYYGRSHGLTMLDLTQRPSWLPKIIYSSVTHAYMTRTNDYDDLRRLAQISGQDPKEFMPRLKALPSRHDYLYTNPLGNAGPAIVNTRR